ncbi:Magnesium and cobalt efflux protein CorC [hydrothermal vent metagenome]|uniref:Magnesium and cobalt efflux protein CorC n=1 Tax=hydrothermal vent metagenome TaxID=652676 RepID=A0A3B1A5X0_9ZZZZ
MSESQNNSPEDLQVETSQPSWFERVTQFFQNEVKDQEQLLDVMQEAKKNNLLDQYSLTMIEGVMQVAEMQVRDIMIPRSQIVVVERESDLKTILPTVIESAHSRFPVIGENKDEVVGILLAKDLLTQINNGESNGFNMREILRPAVFVPESKRLNVLLDEFRANRNHMAIVVDEYGGIAGLVTIEDVLEQIVGEIEDEHDIEEDTYIHEHSNGTSIVKSITPIDEFSEHFNCEVVSDDVDTIGGIVIKALGHMPKRGESVNRYGFNFKVLRASSRRIHLLEVTRVVEPEKNNSTEEQTVEQDGHSTSVKANDKQI